MNTRKLYPNKQTQRIINKNNEEKYIKKNLSFSNIKKENIKETPQIIKEVYINQNKKKNRSLSNHSSMKYIKINPIINPIYERAYFTSKINSKTSNNTNKNNIDLTKIIKNVKLKEESSTSRQSNNLNNLNKFQNMPIHIMNNINIINNNLTNDHIVFMKKRVPNCHRTSLSKPKKIENNTINFEDNTNIYLKKDDNEKNMINIEHLFENYKNKKYKNNIFNKANARKSKEFINIINNDNNTNTNFNTNFKNKSIKSTLSYNINTKINNFIEKNYNTTNNNFDYYIENNEKEQINNFPFKELNLEDFLLIIQKFDDIKNNIKYIFSFYNLNFEQNYISTKKILKLNNNNRIKLYDLFLFFMGSSFDGTPELLFQDKKTKYYIHIWTIIFIISLGILFTVSQNVNLTDECSQEILKLITLQEKIFLIFCDLIIKKLDNSYKYNIWVGQIIEKLSEESSSRNIPNHIIIIRNSIINSFEIINNLLIIIKNFDNHQNAIIKENSKFLFNNFYNADWKDLNEISINQLEKNFNKYIFKSFNISNNNNNIETNDPYKRAQIKNNFNKVYKVNTNIYTNKNINKNISPIKSNINTNTNKNSALNLSKNLPKKIILKSSNSNPLLIKPSKNLNINKTNSINKINIIQYEITIPITPCPPFTPSIPFLDFPQKKPYTLIIDLDETMASFKFTNEKKGKGILYLRPNLENFLEVIKDYYEIIPFTSASRDYADIALDLIEKNERKKYFEKRLYREHTTQFGTKYIKELSKLGRDLTKVIIVDNLSQCFKCNTENGILISSFFGEDENDKALIELQKILIKIYYDKDDVRKSLVKYEYEIFNKISKASEG